MGSRQTGRALSTRPRRSGPKGTSRSSFCCRSRRMPHCDEPSGAYPRTVFRRSECIVFLMTRDRFGKLSNMTGGLPIRAFGETITSAEALYQALRFPHRPEIPDVIIIAERSEEHTSELQ